ncbi:MAG: class I SAM-dependent methyltransferase, partial [Desulfobacteraceae bacterium]|nr:class I SAM-dependent methyltransferase [Desulfobacteraceae bacterium]
DFKDNEYDLILCSYALYFFPDAISEISRVLKDNGIFITITHSSSSLMEIIDIVKDYLILNNIDTDRLLPVEALINKFSHANGCELLSPWFDNIVQFDFINSLEFSYDDLSQFVNYFRFKKTFFIPESLIADKTIVEGIEAKLLSIFESNKKMIITKDDTIFICTKSSGDKA